MNHELLPKISKTPKLLKKCDLASLKKIADESRSKIIDVVMKNGGHLGSNLGVVDLTIALHYVFDLDKDVIVWDGSYQTYTHKFLTGRFENFDSLRNKGGLSGFGWKDESKYDPFNFGHVGTALSAAFGIVNSDDFLRRKRKVISVVGDGALTCGVSYEALNNIASSDKDILVILNDNGFSIAPTIGAISNYFASLRSAQVYSDIKKELKSVLMKIPYGQSIEKVFDSVRRGFYQTLFPNVFTAFGFKYYGPVDGNNMELLIKILTNIRKRKGPTLLHLITKKGCGHPAADTDPFGLHKPVNVQSNKIPDDAPKIEPSGRLYKQEKKTFTSTFVSLLKKYAANDPSIVAITAAMPDGTGLDEFGREFPTRTFDVGISEQHAIAFAAGLAHGGMKPVCAIYSTFLQRAFDQIFQEVCLQKLPVVFAIDRAGLVGEDGPTHHGLFDIGYMRMFPNMVVMAPADFYDFDKMMELSFKIGFPTAIRYPRENILNIERNGNARFELGKGEMLCEGQDVAILALGNMVKQALYVRDQIDSIAVANARFVKPFDVELVKSLVNDYNKILILEDHAYQCGFSSAVFEECVKHGISTSKFIPVAVPDTFIEHASRAELMSMLNMDVNAIKKLCEQVMSKVPARKSAIKKKII
ncbi:MAG: 1-deoxy-D-xylulose-5-phosphate synthase [Planctomycetes bacterium]|nr:1-deoxy-D-xylulose-5-phosphate synthase [Planctomycetota bacterium]